jgi:hypothetical protein
MGSYWFGRAINRAKPEKNDLPHRLHRKFIANGIRFIETIREATDIEAAQKRQLEHRQTLRYEVSH